MTLGNAEHHVEMGVGIAVERRRVQPADNASALADGRVEQIVGPRRCKDTGLWKGDDLDVDAIAPRFAGGDDGMQVCKFQRSVDVDMGTHRYGAKAVRLRQQCLRAFGDRHRVREQPLLDTQSFAKAVGGTMRTPAITDETLVEMDMTFDEGR